MDDLLKEETMEIQYLC